MRTYHLFCCLLTFITCCIFTWKAETTLGEMLGGIILGISIAGMGRDAIDKWVARAIELKL